MSETHDTERIQALELRVSQLAAQVQELRSLAGRMMEFTGGSAGRVPLPDWSKAALGILLSMQASMGRAPLPASTAQRQFQPVCGECGRLLPAGPGEYTGHCPSCGASWDGGEALGSGCSVREREQFVTVPAYGIAEGFQRLMEGRCCYCGERMGNVSLLAPEEGYDRFSLTWSCTKGCNP